MYMNGNCIKSVFLLSIVTLFVILFKVAAHGLAM